MIHVDGKGQINILLPVFAVLAAFFILAGAIALMAVAFINFLGGGTQGAPPPMVTSLWEPVVANQPTFGIPAAVILGIISWESGGQWQATHLNADGSTDAGLMQINSRNWAAWGISSHPHDPLGNLHAGAGILAADLQATGNNLTTALEDYNGGTPGYANNVLARVQQIDKEAVYAWPLQGRQTRGAFGFLGGGTWLAPDTAGPGKAYLIATALCPCGAPISWDGLSIRPFIGTPATNDPLVRWRYTIPGQPSTTWSVMTPFSLSPQRLRQSMPPDTAFYESVLPLSKQPITAEVQAQWTWAPPGAPPRGADCQAKGCTSNAQTTLQIQTS